MPSPQTTVPTVAWEEGASTNICKKNEHTSQPKYLRDVRKASLKITWRGKRERDALSPELNERRISSLFPVKGAARLISCFPLNFLRQTTNWRRTRTGPESLEGRDWNGESHAEGTCAWISLNTKLCLVFRALSEGDEWNSKARVCGMNKKWNCVCQNIPVSMSVSAFRRALRSGADNRNNQCFLPQRTTQGERKSSILANDVFFFPSYHSHHLQVLQIRPFCGQQLLGDKVGPVRWEPLT